MLRRRYKIVDADIAAQIQLMLDSDIIAMNRPATEAGLAVLRAGGDFADGVIAYESTALGADTFASF